MANVTVTPGYVWTSGETVTPTKLNAAATPAATATLADGEVTNAKLASGIDAGKLTAGTLPMARIADGAVVNAKLGNDLDAAKLTTGTLPIARIADGAVTNNKLSLAANAGEIKKAINADNDPPIYACRAWVNFDGTRNEADTGASSNGANVKIRASGNVASVTKNGTGDYTLNFTTAMPDGNYSTVFGYATSVGASAFKVCTLGASQGSPTLKTTTQLRIISGGSNVALDFAQIDVAIFR